MTFKELQKIFEKELGASKLADIAKELDVTPQVVSNWKSRNQVPYKYVLDLRTRIKRLKNQDSEARFNLSMDEAKYIHGLNKGYDKNDDQTFTEFIADIYSFLIPKWKYILITPFVFYLIFTLYVEYLVEPVFTSTAKLLPISAEEKTSGAFRGIASQLGIGFSEQSSTGLSSASMVPDIIKSRLLVKDLLKKEFKSKKYNKSLPLINILSENSNTNVKWSDAAFNAYASLMLLNINIEESKKSALIDLYVNASEPALAKDIASSIIELLNDIMGRFKISQVREKKYFIENRFNEIKNELQTSEEKLKDFRINNRSISSSPSLMLEQSRLLREVQEKTQIYISLKQEFEMVKISEIDVSTVVQILDPPEKPLSMTSPKKAKIKFVGAFLGLVLSIAFIVFKHWFLTNKNLFIEK